MVGVAPKVVQMVAAPHDIGNPGIGVQHLECLLAESLESVTAQFGEGRVVVLAHPVQRGLARDVLEPQEGVRGTHPVIVSGGPCSRWHALSREYCEPCYTAHDEGVADDC